MNISLAAEPLFQIGHFDITNSYFIGLLVFAFLVVVALAARRHLEPVPKGLQNFVEMVFEGLLDFMTGITPTRADAVRFFPLVTTIFIFVLLANWTGLLPGMGTIGINAVHHGDEVFVPFIRAPSADLNLTLAIAISSVLATQVFGIATLGVFRYGSKFFNFSNPIMFFVGLLELVSEGAKVVSFAFRLFGNIFAGEVLLLVVGFLVPWIVPLPFLVLEIFVGLMQALVFATLTLVFLVMATQEHAEH